MEVWGLQNPTGRVLSGLFHGAGLPQRLRRLGGSQCHTSGSGPPCGAPLAEGRHAASGWTARPRDRAAFCGEILLGREGRRRHLRQGDKDEQ